MLSVLFLICNLETNSCINFSPENMVFESLRECNQAAAYMKNTLDFANNPNMMVLHECVEWGLT